MSTAKRPFWGQIEGDGRTIRAISCRSRPICTALAAILLLSGAVTALVAADREPSDEFSAAELLQQARNNREVWQETFPGFRSKLTVTVGGKVYRGSCVFRFPRDLTVSFRGTDAPEGVEPVIRSMIMHRVPSTSSRQETVHYGKFDRSPLGREIVFGGGDDSVYRIRDRQIIQVNRRFGDTNLVLTVVETETTESGRYLPRHVFAVRFDTGTGSLKDAWSYTSRFQRIGDEYLPLSRTIVRADGGIAPATLIEWNDLEVLEPKDGS